MRATGDKEVFEKWIRDEVIPAYDAPKADPSRGFTVEEVRAGLEAHWRAKEGKQPGIRD